MRYVTKNVRPLFVPGKEKYDYRKYKPLYIYDLMVFASRENRISEPMEEYITEAPSESEVYGGRRYDAMNRLIEDDDGKLPEGMDDFFECPYDFYVFRGSGGRQDIEFRRGQNINHNRLKSTSLNPNVAVSFAKFHSEDIPFHYIYQIKVRKGSLVALGNPDEDEIVLHSKQKVKVEFVMLDVSLRPSTYDNYIADVILATT